MKQILIIRSVSFQLLDNYLPAILEEFPGCHIDLLTHEHGHYQALKYKAIRKVYSYPGSKSFSLLCKTTGVGGGDYDAVIIPVANISGSGFCNVLLFSLRVRVKKRYVYSLSRQFTSFTTSRILLQSLLNSLYRGIALLLSLLFVPVLVCSLGSALAWGRLRARKGANRHCLSSTDSY